MASATRRSKIAAAILGLVALSAIVAFFVLPAQHMGTHMHGHHGMKHDEHAMPGLAGENATDAESEEMRVLFRNFQTLSREVNHLPDGIRTVTRSDDPAVMQALVSHVSSMIDRVDTGEDPKVFIQSPTLDVFFLKGEQIATTIDVADEGVIVVQTSQDPELVAALHTHAAEVTDMVERGMQAVHERMAATARN